MQVKVANFTPTTTLSGAPTVMSIVNGKRDDLVAWALGPGCLDVGPHPTVNQSAQYTIASPTEAVSLHKGTNPGVYKFCFKPKRGLWTQITYFFLTILARPIFLPVAGFAGVVTQVVFDASVTAKDGDFVVLHNTTCDNAQLHTTGFSLYIPSPPPLHAALSLITCHRVPRCAPTLTLALWRFGIPWPYPALSPYNLHARYHVRSSAFLRVLCAECHWGGLP